MQDWSRTVHLSYSTEGTDVFYSLVFPLDEDLIGCAEALEAKWNKTGNCWRIPYKGSSRLHKILQAFKGRAWVDIREVRRPFPMDAKERLNRSFRRERIQAMQKAFRYTEMAGGRTPQAFWNTLKAPSVFIYDSFNSYLPLARGPLKTSPQRMWNASRRSFSFPMAMQPYRSGNSTGPSNTSTLSLEWMHGVWASSCPKGKKNCPKAYPSEIEHVCPARPTSSTE